MLREEEAKKLTEKKLKKATDMQGHYFSPTKKRKNISAEFNKITKTPAANDKIEGSIELSLTHVQKPSLFESASFKKIDLQ